MQQYGHLILYTYIEYVCTHSLYANRLASQNAGINMYSTVCVNRNILTYILITQCTFTSVEPGMYKN